MNTETKVGAFTVGGLLLLAIILVSLSGFSFNSFFYNTYHIRFDSVLGLNVGSRVRYSGLMVGKVAAIEAEGTLVHVTVKVAPDIRVPVNSYACLTSDGIMGDKFVNIVPGSDDGRYFDDGAEIVSRPEAGMDSVMDSMTTVVSQLHNILAGVEKITGNPEMQRAMTDTILNIRTITASAAQVTASSQKSLIHATQNIEKMTEGLSNAMAQVERLALDVAGDGKVAADLRSTTADIASAAARIDNMAQALEGTVTNPQVREDLQQTIHNTREITDRANKFMAKGFKSIRPTVGVEVLNSTRSQNHWQANADLRFGGGKSFLLVGMDDIGHESRWNVQYGQKFGKYLTARGGVMEDYFGIGLDYDIGNRFRLTTEVYDVNDITLKVGARYRLLDATYLFARVDDVADRRRRRTTLFGVRQEF